MEIGESRLLREVFIGDYDPNDLVGKEIETSSCDVGWKNVITGNHENHPWDDDLLVDVIAELVEIDDSQYVPEKSHNGGCYLFKYWKVLEVKKVQTFREVMSQ